VSATCIREQVAYLSRAIGKRLRPVGRELLPIKTTEMDAVIVPAARAFLALRMEIGYEFVDVGGCRSFRGNMRLRL
jgi:hypothetical protein